VASLVKDRVEIGIVTTNIPHATPTPIIKPTVTAKTTLTHRRVGDDSKCKQQNLAGSTLMFSYWFPSQARYGRGRLIFFSLLVLSFSQIELPSPLASNVLSSNSAVFVTAFG
jgi:hypothetical protein